MQILSVQTIILSNRTVTNNDLLERAPHKREVRAVGRSVCLCLSIRTFMTRKYTRTVLIYGYLQLLIAAFQAGLVHWFVQQHSTNM